MWKARTILSSRKSFRETREASRTRLHSWVGVDDEPETLAATRFVLADGYSGSSARIRPLDARAVSCQRNYFRWEPCGLGEGKSCLSAPAWESCSSRCLALSYSSPNRTHSPPQPLQTESIWM